MISSLRWKFAIAITKIARFRRTRNKQKSENSRRLWLSEIPCWKSFPANFDAAGKVFPDFPAARNAIPAKVWAFSGNEISNGGWKIGRACGNAGGFSPPRPPQPSYPGRCPNRTELRGSLLVLSIGKATKFVRTRGFSELTRCRNTENSVNALLWSFNPGERS